MKVKKVLKITGIVFLLCVVTLIAAPILFKGKIEDYIKKEINKSVNAEVDFAQVDLSFMAKFPNATINIKDLKVINRAPFFRRYSFLCSRD